MAKRLPPLLALEAFDAAARHLSFKAAAAELNLTPSAISHRVKQIEQHLGLSLFRRLNREIRLTEAGQEYFSTVRKAFDQVAQASLRVGQTPHAEDLRLSAVPNVAATWIIPNLAEFLESRPGLRLFVESSPRHADFARDAIDAAVRFGHGRWPGLSAVKLTDLATTVVCAPKLAAKLKSPRDLRGQTLIHLSTFADAWPRWLRAAGVEGVTAGREVWVDSVVQMLEAAEQGLGVALAVVPLIAPRLADKRLVMPFPVVVPADQGYWFVCRRADAERPSLVALRDWLVDLMRRANTQMAPFLPTSSGNGKKPKTGKRRAPQRQVK